MDRRTTRLASGALLILAGLAALAVPMPTSAAPVSLIRGVLLVGKFRTQVQLDVMSGEDQRNTLITELTNRTRDGVRLYQGLDDAALAGTGALLVFLRETGGRTDQQIKTMSADDMRNTVIVAVGNQTGRGRELQGLTNLQLIRLVMGPERCFIRGDLLTGKFRTQVQLDGMPGEDQRNTLITELAKRTRNDVRFYQGLDDAELAGAGALLVFLRETAGRTDAELGTMTADDLRNTVIVALAAQTHRGDLQGLTNTQLGLTALGSLQAPTPEHLRPGRHVLVFRVGRSFGVNTARRFSDIPFVGAFTGRGTDCTHGTQFPPFAGGAGEAFTAVAGWGQVEGDGHPGANSDQCVSWVIQSMVDFDVRAFAEIPGKALESAILSYREQVAPACMTMVYTQGGLLVDSLPCWTDGGGAPAGKPDGCLSLRVPSEDWLGRPPRGRPVAMLDLPIHKRAPSSWDVTDLFRARHMSVLGSAPTGVGYMLTGEPLDVSGLTADDNTRCTSVVSDVRLEVTYTIPRSTTGCDAEPAQPR